MRFIYQDEQQEKPRLLQFVIESIQVVLHTTRTPIQFMLLTLSHTKLATIWAWTMIMWNNVYAQTTTKANVSWMGILTILLRVTPNVANKVLIRLSSKG